MGSGTERGTGTAPAIPGYRLRGELSPDGPGTLYRAEPIGRPGRQVIIRHLPRSPGRVDTAQDTAHDTAHDTAQNTGRDAPRAAGDRAVLADLPGLGDLDGLADRLRAADHPAIQPILEVVRTAGGIALVLPAPHTPSWQRVPPTGTQAPSARWIATTGALLADAVATVHAAGDVHGAIGPDTISSGPQGRPVLTGFGLAAVLRPGVHAEPPADPAAAGGTAEGDAAERDAAERDAAEGAAAEGAAERDAAEGAVEPGAADVRALARSLLRFLPQEQDGVHPPAQTAVHPSGQRFTSPPWRATASARSPDPGAAAAVDGIDAQRRLVLLLAGAAAPSPSAGPPVTARQLHRALVDIADGTDGDDQGGSGDTMPAVGTAAIPLVPTTARRPPDQPPNRPAAQPLTQTPAQRPTRKMAHPPTPASSDPRGHREQPDRRRGGTGRRRRHLTAAAMVLAAALSLTVGLIRLAPTEVRGDPTPVTSPAPAPAPAPAPMMTAPGMVGDPEMTAEVGAGDGPLAPRRPVPRCRADGIAPGVGTLHLADLDGRGCSTGVRWDGTVLAIASADGTVGRYALDTQGGDQVLVGDLGCQGRDELVVYRPGSGEVFRFAGFAGVTAVDADADTGADTGADADTRADTSADADAGRQLTVTGVASGHLGGSARIVTDAAGCDHLEVVPRR